MVAVVFKLSRFCGAFPGANGIRAQDDETFFGESLTAHRDSWGHFSLMPMPVHIENRGKWSRSLRAIQKGCHAQAGAALVSHFLNAVSILLDRAMHADIQIHRTGKASNRLLDASSQRFSKIQPIRQCSWRLMQLVEHPGLLPHDFL